ncbi:MAG: SxtJ family membrane protein [Chitinophagales bacterium]
MQPKSQVYSNMIAIAAGLLAVHFIFKVSYIDYAALAILVMALLSYSLASMLSKGWMKFAEALGFINSKIILSAIFFLFLFPVAMVYRLFNKDKLRLKKQAAAKTYYTERNHEYQAGDLENSW